MIPQQTVAHYYQRRCPPTLMAKPLTETTITDSDTLLSTALPPTMMAGPLTETTITDSDTLLSTALPPHLDGRAFDRDDAGHDVHNPLWVDDYLVLEEVIGEVLQ